MDNRRFFGKRVILWSAGIAAALLAIIMVNLQEEDSMTIRGGKEWFAGIGTDQFEICNAYYDKVAGLYETLLRFDPDNEIQNTIEIVAEENTPLIEQLPDEMEPEARAAVLKEYYGNLLDALERIKDINR